MSRRRSRPRPKFALLAGLAVASCLHSAEPPTSLRLPEREYGRTTVPNWYFCAIDSAASAARLRPLRTTTHLEGEELRIWLFSDVGAADSMIQVSGTAPQFTGSVFHFTAVDPQPSNVPIDQDPRCASVHFDTRFRAEKADSDVNWSVLASELDQIGVWELRDRPGVPATHPQGMVIEAIRNGVYRSTTYEHRARDLESDDPEVRIWRRAQQVIRSGKKGARKITLGLVDQSPFAKADRLVGVELLPARSAHLRRGHAGTGDLHRRLGLRCDAAVRAKL